MRLTRGEYNKQECREGDRVSSPTLMIIRQGPYEVGLLKGDNESVARGIGDIVSANQP